MRWRLRRAPWTLRRRLVVSVVALFTLLSVIIGGASVISLYDSLLQRLDHSVSRIATGPQGVPDAGSTQDFGGTPGLPIGSVAAIVKGGAASGVILVPGGYKPVPSAQLESLVAVPSGHGPTTVTLGELGSFRAIGVDVSTTQELVFAVPLAEVDGTVTRFGATLAGISLGGILIVAFATWGIVSLALRPLRRVAATATEVASLRLDRGEVSLAIRVPEADTDRRTEVGQVGAALNGMLGHVDAALRARQASETRVRQFVADASHELRTPLASIRGYAELTRRGGHRLPKDVIHSIGRVESEAVRMTSLVEDLLLLARLDEGRDLVSAPVELAPLLVDCVSDAHAAGPDHEWHLELPDEAIPVSGDSQRIHQVVANLLANARVHTPAGTRVTVALTRSEAGSAVVSVTDDGPGIPKDLQPDLFERFARGDTSRSRASGSTGLGLAIVRAVVDAHGGSVTVHSEPGRTEFRVELPGVLSPG